MTNPERELVLRRGPHLWVVDGLATILFAALLAETVNPVVGGTAVIIGAVPAAAGTTAFSSPMWRSTTAPG